jgi:hypothetical protein
MTGYMGVTVLVRVLKFVAEAVLVAVGMSMGVALRVRQL